MAFEYGKQFQVANGLAKGYIDGRVMSIVGCCYYWVIYGSLNSPRWHYQNVDVSSQESRRWNVDWFESVLYLHNHRLGWIKCDYL